MAKELRDLGNRDGAKSVFEKRIAEYITEISQTSALLLSDEYQVAFIGRIGVGKSTAICRMTGLEVPSTDALPPTPVLEAGGGGVTICEVHLRHGPEYGLIVEPRAEDEVHGHASGGSTRKRLKSLHMESRAYPDPRKQAYFQLTSATKKVSSLHG